jgi:hypothetical protein
MAHASTITRSRSRLLAIFSEGSERSPLIARSNLVGKGCEDVKVPAFSNEPRNTSRGILTVS